jgi:aryl-alcohol dehydrogenase-like predicted oxidoreductase
MTHLAIAWSLEHPAVTATIIGPKTMEQLTDLLAADGVHLEPDVLDRIDEIVPPGVTIVGRDDGYEPPELEANARRRR